MKKTIAFLVIFFMLLSAIPLSGTVNAATVNAKSTIARVYVNGGYQPTEAYKIGSVNYYKIQDIAASVRDLSVRFTFVKSGSDIKITTGKNYTMNGTEYSAATLLNYPTKKGGKVQVDGVMKSIASYIINGNYCLTMKEAAKLLGCGFKAVEAGKGTDFQLMTSYKYDASGKLVRKLSEQGNTTFNRLWEGFTASSEDSIYYLNDRRIYKMNQDGTKAGPLNNNPSLLAINLNVANGRLYFTVGGNLRSCDLNGNDEIDHAQPIYVGPNQQMKNMLVVDDSVYCIYNDYDRWANPKNTCNIYQFEMMGKDMIPDTWMRQTIFSVGSSSIEDTKISNFYIEDGYMYFAASWVSRVKLGEYGKSIAREVLAEGQWFQQQKFSGDKIIMMGNEGKNDRWPGKNGYLYTKSITDKNNWSTYLKEKVYTYTVTDDKLVYVQNYNLYTSDLDGKNKRQLLGKDGTSTVLFGLAGDWIVSMSTSDISWAKTTLVKLDGTKASVENGKDSTSGSTSGSDNSSKPTSDIPAGSIAVTYANTALLVNTKASSIDTYKGSDDMLYCDIRDLAVALKDSTKKFDVGTYTDMGVTIDKILAGHPYSGGTGFSGEKKDVYAKKVNSKVLITTDKKSIAAVSVADKLYYSVDGLLKVLDVYSKLDKTTGMLSIDTSLKYDGKPAGDASQFEYGKGYLALSGIPTISDYKLNQAFSTKGFKVMLMNDSNQTKVVGPDDLTFTSSLQGELKNGTMLTIAGTHVVTISYNGLKTTYSFTVK